MSLFCPIENKLPCMAVISYKRSLFQMPQTVEKLCFPHLNLYTFEMQVPKARTCILILLPDYR